MVVREEVGEVGVCNEGTGATLGLAAWTSCSRQLLCAVCAPIPRAAHCCLAAGFMLPNPDDAVIWRGPRWAKETHCMRCSTIPGVLPAAACGTGRQHPWAAGFVAAAAAAV